MNNDIRKLKDNAKYVYGYFPLGGAKVSQSAHINEVHDIRAAGVQTFIKDGLFHFATTVNSCDLPLDKAEIGGLLAIGLFINDLPTGCELNKTDLTALVPVGIPASVKYNEEGEVDGQMTWEEWFAAQGNANVYRESLDGTKIAFRLASRGRYMDSTAWIILAGAGIAFLSWAEYVALLDSETYKIEE